MTSIADITEFAVHHYGTPYQWGGEGKYPRDFGFDCSGFIKRIGARGGIIFTQDLTSKDLFNFCLRNGYAKQEEGCWAFFSNNDGNVCHVGYLINRDIMISAAGGGPDCTTIEIAKAKGAKIQIQPLWWYHRMKLEGCFMPPYVLS